MPTGLRADVITHAHASTIAQIPWLEGKSNAFAADVAIMLKPRLFVVRALFFFCGTPSRVVVCVRCMTRMYDVFFFSCLPYSSNLHDKLFFEF